MKHTLWIFLFLLSLQGLAQDYKRTFNWYFGDSAGLSFATNPPTALSDGKMFSWEGCASISDTNGNLLFYTNGEKVWNKNHDIMELGDLLFGSQDATQTAVIVPQPGNDSIYYIFTVYFLGTGGLRYSAVNMNANGGLGKILYRNKLLQTPACEKLTATHHQNGKDFWIVAHGFKDAGKDDLFYSYLLTEKGLVSCPVFTNIGANHYQYSQSVVNAQGGMKFSPNGKKIAVTVYNEWQKYVEIFDFDKQTGKLSNLIRLDDLYLPIGVEFSPNNNALYVTTNLINRLYQYDLSLISETAIRNSRIEIYYPGFLNEPFLKQLQLAPNGKLYIALVDSDFVSVINNPDSIGLSCDFHLKGPLLSAGSKSEYGLPNFVTSYFYNPKIDYQYKISCPGNAGSFTALTKPSVTSWQWQFRHISDNTIASYSTKQVSHSFSTPGDYTVSLIAGSDTITKTIYIDAPLLTKVDTLGCGVDSVTFQIPTSYSCLQWDDTLASLYSRTIKTGGLFKVLGYNTQGCLVSDSVQILFRSTPPKPFISKFADSLYSTENAHIYQWFTNDTVIFGAVTKNIKALKNGSYRVVITSDSGCSNTSDVFVVNNVGVEPIKQQGITVYPNPVKDIFIIETNEESVYRLFDLSGRELKAGALVKGRNVVKVESLCEGLYLLQLERNKYQPLNLRLIVFRS